MIGAGSVVFDQEPAVGHPRLPGTARRRHRAARHRPRTPRDRRHDGALGPRSSSAPLAASSEHAEPPRRARRRRLRHQHGADRHARRRPFRSSTFRKIRPEADHRRHRRHRRHLPRPADDSLHGATGRRHARALPGCDAAELRQPDEHPDLGGLPGLPRAAGGRPVPQRPVHGTRAGRLSRGRAGSPQLRLRRDQPHDLVPAPRGGRQGCLSPFAPGDGGPRDLCARQGTLRDAAAIRLVHQRIKPALRRIRALFPQERRRDRKIRHRCRPAPRRRCTDRCEIPGIPAHAARRRTAAAGAERRVRRPYHPRHAHQPARPHLRQCPQHRADRESS